MKFLKSELNKMEKHCDTSMISFLKILTMTLYIALIFSDYLLPKKTSKTTLIRSLRTATQSAFNIHGQFKDLSMEQCGQHAKFK